jgi:U6 snRNA-associated Sm-like protein LSm6
MNIALEQTEEHVNGIVTNRYGDAFIRGNNGQMVPPSSPYTAL